MSAQPARRPTWDDLMSDYVMRPARPAPRHRREAPPRTAALQPARDAIRSALRGTGTPAGGLALLVDLQRPNGRAS